MVQASDYSAPAILGTSTYAWLADVLSGHPVTQADRLTGGFVNTMILLTTDHGERYVLRRYHGVDGSTACEVETALVDRLTNIVPVAEVVAADPEGRAVGEPLLISRYVEGVLLSSVLSTVTEDDALAVGYTVGTTLAAIGSVTFSRAGSFHGQSLEPDDQRVLVDLPGVIDRCLATGKIDSCLTKPEQDMLRVLAIRSTPYVDTVTGAHQLVHMDFNPKNVIMAHYAGRWHVAAVIDWEFAFSGSPLVDVGNMLRFADCYPSHYATGFCTGFRDGGGVLPTDWQKIAQALDLFTLVTMLADPPDDATFSKIRTVIRRRINRAS